jgi:hypothetical protein
VIGHALERTGRAKTAERALEEACSPALAHCVAPLRTCCFAMTTAWSLDRDSIAPWLFAAWPPASDNAPAPI